MVLIQQLWTANNPKEDLILIKGKPMKQLFKE